MSDDKIRMEFGTSVPGAPVRVGKRLPGVSIGQAKDMLLGKPVPEPVVAAAARGSEAAHPDLAGHVPTIGALSAPEGAWGVFCMRCSAENSEYVYPCQLDPTDWPPRLLVPYEVTGE